MTSRTIRRLGLVVAAFAVLATASNAQAVAYLQLGTSNASNATTTLAGNTAGAELMVKNANGSSASAFGLYGLLSATSPSVTAAAVRGHNGSTNGRGFGVWGSQAGSGTGVYGYTPSGRGVYGNSLNGIGVLGNHAGTSANSAAGVQGQSAGGDGSGVKGVATSGGYAKGVWGVSGSGYGGYFDAPGPQGYGAYASGGEFGVVGESPSSTGVGVYGRHLSTAGTAAAVRGDSASADAGSSAVYGLMTATIPSSNNAAVRGQNSSTNSYGYGVYGLQAGSGAGVYGSAPGGDGVHGSSTYGWGVYGQSSGGYGVIGTSSSNNGVFGQSSSSTGVHGQSSSGAGVIGISMSGYGGYFSGDTKVIGDLYVSGTIHNPSPQLRIDDPLDPAHKYLQHSSVASSQQLNVYSGNVTTNGKGFATVTMPRWFQALNRSFRYQLTVIGKPGQFVQAMIVKEMVHNRFTLETSKPKVKVSWQVTGIRHDRFAKAHPVHVIAPKAKADQGKYLHPDLYGKPKSQGIGYRKPPRLPEEPSHKR
jgi:hypothetical protein